MFLRAFHLFITTLCLLGFVSATVPLEKVFVASETEEASTIDSEEEAKQAILVSLVDVFFSRISKTIPEDFLLPAQRTIVPEINPPNHA